MKRAIPTKVVRVDRRINRAFLLQEGKVLLRGRQKLVISGCLSENDAWIISANELVPDQITSHYSNAEDDNRIWRHAYQSRATRILIYSPDTDTYHIGLGLLSGSSKEYIIQINITHSNETKYLCLNNLQTALLNDPDLGTLPIETTFLKLYKFCLFLLDAILFCFFQITWKSNITK